MPAARPTDATSSTKDARRLSTLLEVSQALSGTLNLKASLQRVLGTLIRHHSVERGMVTLLRDGELQVEAVEGFEDRTRSLRLAVGEGITGKVVESGKPIVVPRVSKEPQFLNLAQRRTDTAKHEMSFICVPITLNRVAMGALGVDLRFKAERDYDSSVKFFAAASAGREHAPSSGAEGALRLLQHHRDQRTDASGLRTGGAGHPDQHHGAHPRRVGHR
jgi:Nif-specific regulatory protein